MAPLSRSEFSLTVYFLVRLDLVFISLIATIVHILCPPGSACEFVVNTSNAGPGALAVTIDGPSKVKMDCVECPEGYRVTYTPMAPGNYLISIKYGGPYHIVGSPFKAKITGKQGLCFSGKQNVRVIYLEEKKEN